MKVKKVTTAQIHMMFAIGLIVFLGLAIYIFNNTSSSSELGLRALPRPIAGEPLLITSAGQSTDIYVMKDIANKLRIDNYFIPLASPHQLEDMASVVLVVGYSEVGMRINEMDFEDEVKRVSELLAEIKERDISLTTIYLRGEPMLSTQAEQLLDMAAKSSDYMIIVDDSGKADIFNEMASIANVPLTIVKSVTEVSEPFVSVFR